VDDGGIRMPPDHWLVHRKKQGFRGPNCLCPLLRTTNEESSLTEAQIVLKESGDHIGQYIAECPNGRCEYFGELPVACVALIVYEILKKNSSLGPKVCFIWHSRKEICAEK